MDVTATTATASSTAATASPAPAGVTVAYDAFLRLLVTQLRNQDPTDPQDSTQYLAQLAQFSSVEQQVRANARLDDILAALALGQSGGLIGRSVADASGAVSGVVTAVRLDPAGAAAVLDGGRTVKLADLASVW